MISWFLRDRVAKYFGNTYGYPKLPGKIWARSLTRPASTRAWHFYYYRYVVKWMRFGFLAKIWYLWTSKMAANLSNYLSNYVEISKNVFSPKFIGIGLPHWDAALLQYSSKSVFQSGRTVGLQTCSNFLWTSRIPIPMFWVICSHF